MIIAFGTKAAHDKLMEAMHKLAYSPMDLEELKGITAADEVVVAYRDNAGKLTLDPTGISLDEWIDRFGSRDTLHDGSWGEMLDPWTK